MTGYYPLQILNTAESVIDKGINYPECLKKEEVGVVSRLAARACQDDSKPEFSEAVHKKVKEMFVGHFPEIEDLSTDGFRPFEKYAKMYNIEFMFNFTMTSNSK